MGEVKISAKGNNGEFIVYENSIEIRRRGVLLNIDSTINNTNTTILNERVINLDDLLGIEFVPATSIWKNGYISLIIKGELKNRQGLRGAAKDPASIVFWTKMNEEFKAVADYLLKEIDRRKTQKVEIINNISNNSLADELRKLKELHDAGVISDEEFYSAKQKVLSK